MALIEIYLFRKERVLQHRVSQKHGLDFVGKPVIKSALAVFKER
ncbi:unnamed protein product, partial [marine sediment metagenome]